MEEINEDIIRFEFIGKEVKSKNKSGDETKGKIIDETKNVFVIRKKDGERKMIMKKGNIFEIKMKNKSIMIKGDLLVGRPEDRIKTKVPK